MCTYTCLVLSSSEVTFSNSCVVFIISSSMDSFPEESDILDCSSFNFKLANSSRKMTISEHYTRITTSVCHELSLPSIYLWLYTVQIDLNTEIWIKLFLVLTTSSELSLTGFTLSSFLRCSWSSEFFRVTVLTVSSAWCNLSSVLRFSSFNRSISLQNHRNEIN